MSSVATGSLEVDLLEILNAIEALKRQVLNLIEEVRDGQHS